MQAYIALLFVVAIISCASSALVIATSFMFRELRGKLFMRMIAFMSFSDFLGNLPYAIPYRPSTNNAWCKFSGYLNITCYPMSWLWTTILVFFLYKLAITGKVPPNIEAIHALCWGLPNVLSLISLGFSSLGRESYYYDFEVCSEYGGTAHSIYHDVTYYGLLILNFSLMIAMFRRILMEEKNGDARIRQPTYIIAKSSLQLYPLALAICWIPHMVTSFAATSSDSDVPSFRFIYMLAEALKIFHGSIAAMIFFYKSEDARRLWIKFILGQKNDSTDNEDDEEIFATTGSSSFAIESPPAGITNILHDTMQSRATVHI